MVQDELGRINKLVIGNADLVRLYYDDFSIYGEYAISLPILRPMSSMTKEEKEELKTLFDAKDVTNDSICYLEGGTLEEYLSHISYSFCSKIIDWLNKHHFDFRGLISKRLAIEVTEENNPYK